MFIKFLNMDIFPHKTASLRFRRPLLTPWCHYFYDGLIHFWGASKSKLSFTPIIKLGRAWIIVLFNSSDCVWLKEESHKHLA